MVPPMVVVRVVRVVRVLFPYGARFFPVPLCTGNAPVGLDVRGRLFADHHGWGCGVAGRYLEKQLHIRVYIFSFNSHVSQVEESYNELSQIHEIRFLS